MRRAAAVLAFLAFAVPSMAEIPSLSVWPETGELGGVLPAAIGGSYVSVATVGFVSYTDQNDSEAVLSYRYYLPEPVFDEDDPYRLQPFLQRATYLGGSFTAGVGDSTLLAAEGIYFFEGIRLGVGGRIGSGQDQSVLGAEVIYHFTPANDLALEIGLSDSIVVTERLGPGKPPKPVIREETKASTYSLGARYVTRLPAADAVLEIAGGYRHSESEGVAFDGFVAEARYFFDKHVFAGIRFNTDPQAFGISGGYTAPKDFHAELEIGTDDAEPARGGYFKIEVGLRF